MVFILILLFQIFGRQEKNQTVPQEIDQDPYARELYEKALKDGKEKDKSIRINIVGNYRQGKTSLMRRLLYQSLSGVESTNGIDIGKYECLKSSSGKLTYIKAAPDDNQKILKRLVRVALSESENASVSACNEAKVTDTNEEPEPDNKSQLENKKQSDTLIKSNAERTGAVSDLRLGSRYPSNTSKKDVDNQLTNVFPKSDNDEKIAMLTMEQKRKFEKEIRSKPSLEPTDKIQTSFDFWDFGGQFVFYATHTMFHSRRAIYLLVFDLSTPLNQAVIDEDFPSEQGSKTMAYYIQFWMNSIHSFVGTDDGNEPVVLLVGTHKDKIPGSDETKNKYIQQYFSDIRELFDNTCLLNHIYPQDFAVNNQITKDQAVDALRNTVMEIGDNLSSTVEIPAKWIQLEKLLNERKRLKIIQLDVIKSVDSAMEYPLGSEEQIKLFLQYHHSKGSFIFFDEPPISDYIILDPQFLIDAFKSIITSERFCTNDPVVRPLWKRLRTEARLEKSLIERQWGKTEDAMFLKHRDILLGFLTKHHIISEATQYDEQTNNSAGLGWYIVPSFLRDMSTQSEVTDFLKGRDKSSLRFTMQFVNSAVVLLVYYRLTAALTGRWSVAQVRDKPLVFQNLCIVRLTIDYVGVSRLNYDCIELFLVKLPLSEIKSQSEQGDSFRRFAESVIKHEFRKLKADDERKTMPFTVCFRCNHESHGMNGSINILSKTHLDEHKHIPCPDLEAHDIYTETAKAEWYTDIPLPNTQMNYVLNDKMLGKLSQCIGSNWQLLGLELGLSQVQVDHIIEDNPYSTSMKIFSMLKQWRLKMSSDATMEKLVIAMKLCPGVTIDWDEIRNLEDQLHL